MLTTASLISAHPGAAQDGQQILATPKPCGPPEGTLPPEAPGESHWTACETWVWSCVVQGKEANLFAKTCTNPRRDFDEPDFRAPYAMAPFYQPDDFAETNALSDGFVRALLAEPKYAQRIPPAGIRIFGAYFARSVNLENVTTLLNLVLDGGIFERGIRMTNFETTKNVSFDGANVRGKMLLMRARLGGSLFMERGVYDFVDLRDARIGASLEASRSVFTDMLRFDRAHISGKVYLVKSLITAINAWDSSIGGSMELRLASIRLRLDLTGATVQGDVRLQEVSSGRLTGDGKNGCDWDPDQRVDHVLHEAYGAVKTADPALSERVLDEMMRKRPTLAGKPDETLCNEATAEGVSTARHAVLLRDMKINGTLCVMDTTGRIGDAPADSGAASGARGPASMETISLDGTEANSTVLRWLDSDSTTLWHAVNFKTGHMLINLQAQPAAHFIDNLDVGFISFVKRDTHGRSGGRDEDDDKYLCDVTPRKENVEVADDRVTQDKILQFFTGPANNAGSAQPFAHIVERLTASGVNTKYLDISLSKYKYRNLCQTSQLMRNWSDLPWRPLKERLSTLSVDEVRKLVLDGFCTAGIFSYGWLVSYGHEPLNLFLWVIVLILAFWLALRLDRSDPADLLGRRRYPITYAIDNFNPLRPYRINRRHAESAPNSWWLRAYLGFHRLLGVVFAILFFIFVYRASK